MPLEVYRTFWRVLDFGIEESSELDAGHAGGFLDGYKTEMKVRGCETGSCRNGA